MVKHFTNVLLSSRSRKGSPFDFPGPWYLNGILMVAIPSVNIWASGTPAAIPWEIPNEPLRHTGDIVPVLVKPWFHKVRPTALAVRWPITAYMKFLQRPPAFKAQTAALAWA